MNRDLAALNPAAADQWSKDKVAESMLNGRPRAAPVEITVEEGTRAFRAMDGLGTELRVEVDADAIRNNDRGKQVWDSV